MARAYLCGQAGTVGALEWHDASRDMPNGSITHPAPAFDLLPAALQDTLPRLYSQEHVADPIVHVRLFFSAGAFTAYVTEGTPEPGDGPDAGEWTLFGYVVDHASEFGYLSLNELRRLWVHGLKIERDLWFTPDRLSVVLQRDGHPPFRRG